MLLLQRRGPSSFVVKDASGLKNGVQIGGRQSCTCSGKRTHGRAELCAHIIFVMVKVLQIPTNDPLVWQLALTGACRHVHLSMQRR